MASKNRWRIGILILLVGAAVLAVLAIRLQEDSSATKSRGDTSEQFGAGNADITELLYRIEPRAGAPPRDYTSEVIQILRRRLKGFSASHLRLSTVGRERIRVELAGLDVDTIDSAKQTIERGGALSFHLKSPSEYQDARSIEEIERASAEWEERVTKGETPPEPPRIVGIEYARDQPTLAYMRDRSGKLLVRAKYALENSPAGRVSGVTLESAVASVDANGLPCIAYSLNSVGAKEFGRFTGENVNQKLFILIDEEVVAIANIDSAVYDSGVLQGQFTDEEIKNLVNVLNGGSLPVRLVLEN